MLEEPFVRFVCGQRELKGEDVAFAHENWELGECSWKIFCVCDGHGGPGAAEFVERNLLNTLGLHLPKTKPPPWGTDEGKIWANKISEALTTSFVALDEEFAEMGCGSGTTVSVALLSGWLLTVANVGDSEVFLDVGGAIGEMTSCHKVHSNQSEQQRLLDWGATVDSLSQFMLGPPREGEMGIGPLRAWPGGVAVSRSLGDFDCCNHVIPIPNIRQVIVPMTGARLVMASDGLWDFYNGPRACKTARSSRLEKAPARLFRGLMFQTDGTLLDDTTIMVIDILPAMNIEFRDAMKMAKKARKRGLFSKMKHAFSNLFKEGHQKKVEFYSDVDGLMGFPTVNSSGFSIFSAARNKMGEQQPPANAMVDISVKEYRYPHLMEERMLQIQKATSNPADIFRDDSALEENNPEQELPAPPLPTPLKPPCIPQCKPPALPAIEGEMLQRVSTTKLR
ncbi:hypothetical protein BSKO_11029 [Bryopsis sp. KO-2023]|nr:hypothetical protein BSKO_11029 [Bryopsis sp. KO-2023]